jgi:hypothetical protein
MSATFVEHANSEVVGIHAARSANRFEALQPVRQGVHRCFEAITPGLAPRHDPSWLQLYVQRFPVRNRMPGYRGFAAFVRNPGATASPNASPNIRDEERRGSKMTSLLTATKT